MIVSKDPELRIVQRTEKPNLLYALPGRIARDRANIENAEAGAVVGLVCKAVGNVLVVVHTLGARLVVSYGTVSDLL